MIIITTFVGLILVYLILSLLASSIQESLAAWFSLRAKTMAEALEKMLVNESIDGDASKIDSALLKSFQNHSIFADILPQRGWYHRVFGTPKAPSYMNPKTFSDILLHTLDGSTGDKLAKAIDEMSDGKLKDYLKRTLEDANNDVEKFRIKMEDWYNSVMDRASGWYKRNVHNMLLIIGFLAAIGFNADTFAIYSKLSKIQPDSAEEQAINQLAGSFIDSEFEKYNNLLQAINGEIDSLNSLPDSLQSGQLPDIVKDQTPLGEQIMKIRSEINGTASPLGLGWTQQEFNELKTAGFVSWLTKFLGFLISAFAISLGAPFWFDMLRKIINIRNAGPVKSS